MRGASIFLVLVVLLTSARLPAQVDPRGGWRTLRTTHFYLHFRPETESLARRAAVEAERAYVALSATLKRPRGMIDLVLSDDVDYSNGFASAPVRRIVIYAHPPLDAGALRTHDDWLQLVITHELAHIFHLDRSRGIWRLGQYAFGRHPGLFPNLYSPRWFTEGLAVFYETELTGSGRLAGDGHRMIARADIIEPRGLPRIDELSLSTSRYPHGGLAYVYGSLLLEHAARTRGVASIGRMVELSSASLLPVLLRPSTGVDWTSEWRLLRDSLLAGMSTAGGQMSGWRQLRGGGRTVQAPRWLDSASIIYSYDGGRETAGAYRSSALTPNARPRRLGRRNSLDANTPLPDGSIVFAQLDYTDRFHVRSDLWLERGATQTPLTRGARLSQPDARGSDGMLVAVQGVPGASRLVLLHPDSASAIRLLTAGNADTGWAEPRWSPDGSRIAAVRWRRGGWNAIVTIDPATCAVRVLHESRTVNAMPAWLPAGQVVFASEATGSSQLYQVDPAAGDGVAPVRLTNAETGVFEPAPSSDGTSIAATLYRADGFHVVLASLPLASFGAMPPVTTVSRLGPVDTSDAPSKPYRALRSLLPRFWEPRYEQGFAGATLYGAHISGSDALDRHAFVAEALRDSRTGAIEYSSTYWFRGLGQPEVALGTSTQWGYGSVRDTLGRRVAEVQQRARAVSAALTTSRPRIRSSSFLSAGATLQWNDFRINPADFADIANPFYRTKPTYRSAFLSGGISNLKRPSLSIAPEDGISLSATAEQTWVGEETPRTSRRIVTDARGFLGMNLGAFAHHVLALRGAWGFADARAVSPFNVGGGSGSSVELVPGYSIGGNRRTFSVRGFSPATQTGTRAFASSAEVRWPLLAPSRGLPILPLFIDRVTATTFVDAGSAWCHSEPRIPACEGGRRSLGIMASGGAELIMDAAPRFDFAYRFRLGFAAPFRVPGDDPKPKPSVYIDFGTYF